MSESTNLNIAVVGAGPGGYAAAFLAADLGMSVTLIDPEVNPGGVCLYRGCIPSKSLLHIAKLIEESHEATKWGIEFGAPKIDLNRLRSFKENVVKKLTGGLGILSKQRKVKYVQGRAAFENSSTLRVTKSDGSEESLSFDRIILATGSRPAVIPTFKLDTPRIMDSTGALNLEDIPSTLLVVGGGYIGVELGSVYAALGTRVTVVEMLPGLLPGADRDLVLPLHKRLEKMFDAILLNTTVAAVTDEGSAIRATLKAQDGSTQERLFDRVLVSVGRKPKSPASTRLKSKSDQKDSFRSTSSCKPAILPSPPSEMWSASPCSRTRLCTKAAPPSKPSRDTKLPSNPQRFLPSSSPIPKSLGPA